MTGLSPLPWSHILSFIYIYLISYSLHMHPSRVFVLSALKPGDEWERAMGNVWRMLKPGGMVLLRDYGRHDLAQMRIKGNRMLDEDFYIRGDGTRVFFFDAGQLGRIALGSLYPFTFFFFFFLSRHDCCRGC